MTFEKYKEEIDRIYLDYDDIKHDEFIKDPSIRRKRINHALTIAKQMNISVSKIQARKSSSGRLHIAVWLLKPISAEWHFIYRVRCQDCVGRLTSDLRRWSQDSGDIGRINRIFCQKFDIPSGETRIAGEWSDIWVNGVSEE